MMFFDLETWLKAEMIQFKLAGRGLKSCVF